METYKTDLSSWILHHDANCDIENAICKCGLYDHMDGLIVALKKAFGED